MDFEALLAARAARREALTATRSALEAEGALIISTAQGETRSLTEAEDARSLAIVTELRETAAALTAVDAEITQIRAAQEEVAAQARAATERHATGATSPAARVTTEPRTYAAETDQRGVQFLHDVARAAMGNHSAGERLARHMAEERVERSAAGTPLLERATGTGNFEGLVIPQYLTDLYAPLARAGRPFADATRHHDLPPTGMTAYIGRVTTGTSVDDQATQNTAVSETDIDDTLMSVGVATAAGSQTLSRQAVDRGIGADDITTEDLIRAYHTNLDSKILNKAAVGLAQAATSITYTAASPSALELYPKIIGGVAAVEGALLDQALGDAVVLMHSRRWYWLQAQLTNQWPLFGQPGIQSQVAGENYGERYGAGFRGLLPNGTPVIVDNNVVTNLGAGTNQDEIYIFAQSEAHLWEDPNAPLLIRAEQPKAKTLGIDLVVYGYYAFTAQRRPHAQKITGTGLAAPTF